MSTQRIHYVTTTDGVTIGGAVHGQGPPLVFLHGIAFSGRAKASCWSEACATPMRPGVGPGGTSGNVSRA